ncbi:histone H3.v1 [Oryzias latipes]|uniref:histone H3.v1 n=1 Tax=Oryzias latipes TaxID=8090 RepID=UPI0005CC08A3|nr:histone H3.v1 [Oryzias latipes]
MDIQPQRRQPLEAIQEESEQEDEAESRRSSEKEYHPLQVAAQAEEVLNEENKEEEEEEEEEEDEEDDDDEPLRVLRSRSRSRLSRTSLIHTQSRNDEVQNVSVADLSTKDIDVSRTSPQSDSRECISSRSFRLKASEISWEKLSEHTPSVKKKKHKFKDELFPPWVVNLMINIEEATSHQLVVE